MKKAFYVLAILIFCSYFKSDQVSAQNNKPQAKALYYKAEVVTVIEEGFKKVGNKDNIFQNLGIVILEGPEKGNKLSIEHGGLFKITEEQKLKKGDVIILSINKNKDETQYRIADTYRLPKLLYITLGFFILVVIMAGKRGLGSFAGMAISVAVIVLFIIPQILNGRDPLLISLFGSLFIMAVTIYLAHGFSRQTTVAVLSTLISLSITVVIAIYSVEFISLSGLGSEDIYTLMQGFTEKINFQGLLLGGIIIGTLGVLDDVTTTQTATIFTLSQTNHNLSMKELFTHGMRIGREHIASLVNTLVLAYAGASIGIFIFLIMGLRTNSQPLWVILNSELIMEEVIRTIVGSVGLILAVPITTLLASFFAKYSLKVR